MKLIATHDSATGEKPGSILSYLVLPFARTQSKTIKEQYDAGCRMFDIRIRWVNHSWRCAHGLFWTNRFASDILSEINGFDDKCYVMITYEGKFKDADDTESFIVFNHWARSAFPNINFGPVAVKYADKGTTVDWVNILPGVNFWKNRKGFIPLDGKTWQTYLMPIPWLVNKLFTRKHSFNEEEFIFVDFL